MEDNIYVEVPCPSCGNAVPDDVCPKCSFSFSSVLKCPKLLEDGSCEENPNVLCNINGMNWECCNILRG
jgi:hypothetical protein